MLNVALDKRPPIQGIGGIRRIGGIRSIGGIRRIGGIWRNDGIINSKVVTQISNTSIKAMYIQPKLGGVIKMCFNFARKSVNFECFWIIPSLYKMYRCTELQNLSPLSFKV